MLIYNDIESIVKFTVNGMFGWVSKIDWLGIIGIH